MTAYDLMIKINHQLIAGRKLSDDERRSAAQKLLGARSTENEARRFWDGVHYSGNRDASGREMYPMFFIPPYNGGSKYRTVLDQTPKTHILSANMYELEILRLLDILKPGDAEVAAMTARTSERLRTTCFGNDDDGVGECFDTSLVVLRFLAQISPNDIWRIKSRMDVFEALRRKKARFGSYMVLLAVPFRTAGRCSAYRYRKI
ncbi:MAG: hypothetical protein WCQ72_03370 [Eubacteriales bacterium]